MSGTYRPLLAIPLLILDVLAVVALVGFRTRAVPLGFATFNLRHVDVGPHSFSQRLRSTGKRVTS